MFRQLYLLPSEGQRDVAVSALSNYYVEILDRVSTALVPESRRQWPGGLEDSILELQDSEQLDPADAEFENGLMQFNSALSR